MLLRISDGSVGNDIPKISIITFLLLAITNHLTFSYPNITPGQSNCRIRENTPINSVVCNIEKTNSININGKVNLILYTHKTLFRINKHGQLTVNSIIDRESLEQQNCEVRNQKEPTICTIIVEIINKSMSREKIQIIQFPVDIEDENDNSPTFDKLTYTVEIDENIAPNTQTLSLPIARDMDLGANSQLKYSLRGRDKIFFRLLHSTDNKMNNNMRETVQKPFLRPIKALDREERDQYELILVAKDSGLPSKTGEIKLIIRVRDINDHPPIIDLRGNTIYKVNENNQEGTKICDITVTDKDIDSRITLKINPNADSIVKQHFEVNLRSGLILISRLDYESPHKQFKIPLIAYDSGVPSLTTSATLTVKVLDYNDNPPKITVDSLSEMTSNFRVSENSAKSTFIALVTVLDEDSGANGDTYCMLSEANDGMRLGSNFNFQLDGPTNIDNYYSKKRTYRIITLTKFDREVKNHYRLTIKCIDKGVKPLKSEQTLTVWIDDENDEPPKFERSHYQVRIKENIPPGNEIINIQAKDRDMGVNARTIYKIPDKYSSMFRLHDSSSGLVKNVVPFDRELNKSLTFQLLAIDAARNELNSSTMVTVVILDENDCSPIFVNQNYRFIVKEGQSGFIGRVEAYDNDTNMNGLVQFRLKNELGNSNLWYVKKDGNIFAKSGKLLDREKTPSYHITIIAIDKGIPPRSTTTPVSIELEDINDNAPVIREPSKMKTYALTLSETMPVGSVITTISATDPDLGDNGKVNYKLSTNNKYFKIDPNTGEVSINKTLKKSKSRDFFLPNFNVIAHDNGKIELSSSIRIIVKFINEYSNNNNNENNENGGGGNYNNKKYQYKKEYNPYANDRRNGNQQNYDKRQNDNYKRRNNGFLNLPWNSKEILIGLTVGSVVLIVVCGVVLLIYVWCQSRANERQMEKHKDTEFNNFHMNDTNSEMIDQSTFTNTICGSCIQSLCPNSSTNQNNEIISPTNHNSRNFQIHHHQSNTNLFYKQQPIQFQHHQSLNNIENMSSPSSPAVQKFKLWPTNKSMTKQKHDQSNMKHNEIDEEYPEFLVTNAQQQWSNKQINQFVPANFYEDPLHSTQNNNLTFKQMPQSNINNNYSLLHTTAPMTTVPLVTNINKDTSPLTTTTTTTMLSNKNQNPNFYSTLSNDDKMFNNNTLNIMAPTSFAIPNPKISNSFV